MCQNANLMPILALLLGLLGLGLILLIAMPGTFLRHPLFQNELFSWMVALLGQRFDWISTA